MGSGNLGEKIRTYNWPNNRITDHRIGVQKFGLDAMFEGSLLQEFLEELEQDERRRKLDEILK
jgi:peptide chain release factor 1